MTLVQSLMDQIQALTAELDPQTKHQVLRELRDQIQAQISEAWEASFTQMAGARVKEGSVAFYILQALSKPRTLSYLTRYVSRARGKKIRYQQVRHVVQQLESKGVVKKTKASPVTYARASE